MGKPILFQQNQIFSVEFEYKLILVIQAQGTYEPRFSCWNLGNKLTFLMKPGVLEHWNDGMDSPCG